MSRTGYNFTCRAARALIVEDVVHRPRVCEPFWEGLSEPICKAKTIFPIVEIMLRRIPNENDAIRGVSRRT